MTSIDLFAGDTGINAGDNILASIRHKVLELKEAEANLAKKEEAFKLAQRVVKQITEVDLPELMETAGQDALKTADGFQVVVKENVRAHIKAENQPRAFGWLISEGHEKLIQRVFTFKFGNNQDAAAGAFEDAVLRLDDLPDYDDKKSVHSSSLSSFVKAELEAGREVPMDLLGVHRQRVATVK